jgi:hypothetical protein
MTQTYFTFGHDGVIEFQGYLDTLYGTVTPDEDDKNVHRLPYNHSVLNRDVWKTQDEAIAAYQASVTKDVQSVILRYRKACEQYPGFFVMWPE